VNVIRLVQISQDSRDHLNFAKQLPAVAQPARRS